MHDRPAPRATYRLQLHKGFRFGDVSWLAPYLAGLGVSHAYLSPILMARPGSMHGYDTVDHTRINPELGTRDEFCAMAADLQRHGVGIILDIVPNHMGIGGADNPLWLDVLKHGEASRYASWFDIDWRPAEPSLAGKVLVPLLGGSYGEALAAGLLELKRGADGRLALRLPGDHLLPLSPESDDGTIDAARLLQLNSAAGQADLDTLLARQHWRVAQASVASDDINYRRFFAISDLAGIRIERAEVFEPVHRLVFELIAEGFVDGLRIDHIDGLHDPKAYCLKLREMAPRPVYIVVEKILADGERLPSAWDVEGTTGYDFASLVTPLLVDPRGEPALSQFHREFTGVAVTPVEMERQAKREVLDGSLAAELEALSLRFAALARRTPATRDFTRSALRRGLREFIAATPVYRTYVDGAGSSAADAVAVATAIAAMRDEGAAIDEAVVDFIHTVILRPHETIDSKAATALAMRLQQLTGPVMAKGLEDTALYRFSRLLALNDVGERPVPFSRTIAAFHAANLERAQHSPLAMLGTSSHDSKRGEDARARLAALSGHAEAWCEAVPLWMALLRALAAPEVAADDAYVAFQLMLGAWPGESSPEFAERVVGAMRKSVREAGLRSSWARPAADYEAAVQGFVRTALDGAGQNPFLAAFRRFEARMALDGAINGLIEAALKFTVPGVPDIYQGAELWEQSLVDPDNRRPVDFALRQGLLAEARSVPLAELLDRWRDGAIKQALIARLLAARRRKPALFAAGSYEPLADAALEASGICAFARRHGDDLLLVAVRLYPWRGAAEDGPPLPFERFGAGGLTDLLTGNMEMRPAFAERLPIAIFGNFGATGTA